MLERALRVLGNYYDAEPLLAPDGRLIHPRSFWASAGTVRAALAWALTDDGGPPRRAAELLYVTRGTWARVDRFFRARFGKPLLRRWVRGRPEYDPDGLRAAFSAIYVPPSAKIGGVEARVLYQPLAGFVASAASVTAHMLDEPGKLARVAHRVDLRGGFKWEDADPWGADPFDVVTVGVVLRRHLDGTLPVVVDALRTVLRDYDPDTFAELNARLRVQ